MYLIDFGLCVQRTKLSSDRDWSQFVGYLHKMGGGHPFFMSQSLLLGRSIFRSFNLLGPSEKDDLESLLLSTSYLVKDSFPKEIPKEVLKDFDLVASIKE